MLGRQKMCGRCVNPSTTLKSKENQFTASLQCTFSVFVLFSHFFSFELLSKKNHMQQLNQPPGL